MIKNYKPLLLAESLSVSSKLLCPAVAQVHEFTSALLCDCVGLQSPIRFLIYCKNLLSVVFFYYDNAFFRQKRIVTTGIGPSNHVIRIRYGWIFF